VQLLCLELRRYGAGPTQLAEAGLQPRERREVQLLARSLPLLLCSRVLSHGVAMARPVADCMTRNLSCTACVCPLTLFKVKN
jgi:hypothetical protein